MRYLSLLILIVTLSSFSVAQEKGDKTIPSGDSLKTKSDDGRDTHPKGFSSPGLKTEVQGEQPFDPYRSLFPKRSMETMVRMSNGWARPEAGNQKVQKLNPILVKPLSHAFSELFGRCDYVFWGETHLVSDEKPIGIRAEELTKWGVNQIPIEFPKELNGRMQTFVTSKGGEKSLNFPWNRIAATDWKPVLQLAMDHPEFKVVGVDIKSAEVLQPRTEQTLQTLTAREEEIAQNLKELPAEGKKLVVLGNNHAQLSSMPFPTVRTILNRTHKTCALRFESTASIMAFPSLRI